EKATTPRRRSSSPSCRSALSAPRILNEPARCRFSHFRRTSTPILSESEWFGRRGVRWMEGPMRRAAARTSSKAVVMSIFEEVTFLSINSRKTIADRRFSGRSHNTGKVNSGLEVGVMWRWVTRCLILALVALIAPSLLAQQEFIGALDFPDPNTKQSGVIFFKGFALAPHLIS